MANKVLDTRILMASDTTANLVGSSKVWMKGEIIVEFCANGKQKIKIGDGVHTWNDLKYYAGAGGGSSVQVIDFSNTSKPQDAWDSVSTEAPEDGQMIVVKSPAGGTVGYIWNEDNTKWITFSGNVLAENVFFTDDITCAGAYTQVGNISKTQNGTTTISTTGKSLLDLMTQIFTQELQPTKTEPSVSLTFSQAGEYEVGTTVTPSWSATLNAGSYTYGPATGVSATAWTITDTAGNSDTVASGSFASFVVGDSTNYKITAKVDYNAGAVANTNMGNPSSPTVQIAAGDKSKTSSAVTGYRSMFYGVVNNTNALDSAAIRALTNGGKTKATTVTVSVNGNTSAKRIIVAIPTASGKKVTTVSKTDGLVTDITSTYSKTGTVMVDGANNVGSTVSYDIWTYQPASIDAAEVHEITIG